jgi:uncharacterized damage-inducible protein DinB
MDLIDHFRRQFAYDEWANREVLSVLKTTTKDTTRSLQLLAHIVSAERLWLERILGQPQSLAVWPEFSLEQCEAQIADVAAGWREFLATLTPAELARQTQYKNSKGELWTSTVQDILSHVALHSAYHRGQIATQMRGAGETPAYTDFIHAARQNLME